MSDLEPRKKITVIIEDEETIQTSTFFCATNLDARIEYEDTSVWEPKLNDPTHISFPRPTSASVSFRFIASFSPDHQKILEGKVEPK